MVHVSEISKEKITTPVGMYNIGDTLKVKVINVSSKDRKIGLSIKALDKDSSEDSLQDYKKKQSTGPSTIGDLLKSEMESKETTTKDDIAEAAPEEEAVAEAEAVEAEIAPEEEVVTEVAEAEAAPEEEVVAEAALEEEAVAEADADDAAPEEEVVAEPEADAADAADKK